MGVDCDSCFVLCRAGRSTHLRLGGHACDRASECKPGPIAVLVDICPLTPRRAKRRDRLGSGAASI